MKNMVQKGNLTKTMLRSAMIGNAVKSAFPIMAGNARKRLSSGFPQELAPYALRRLPGFTGPVPSATLDKSPYSDVIEYDSIPFLPCQRFFDSFFGLPVQKADTVQKSAAAMKNRRQGLVNQEAENGIQQAFHKRKGHVEHDQAEHQVVGLRVQFLVSAQDQIHAAEHLGIYRVGDVVVDRHADQCHDDRTDQCADGRHFAALVMLIDQARNGSEECPQQKVTHFPDTAGGAMENGCQNVLDQAHSHTVHRAQAEGSQQSRQFGDVHLDKERDEHGQAEIHHHQHKANRRKHGGHSKFTDMVLGLHKKYLPAVAARQNRKAGCHSCREACFVATQKRPAAKKMQQGAGKQSK